MTNPISARLRDRKDSEILGGITVTNHISSKGQCEEDYNVNYCERNLTYTPTYPEVPK